MEKRWYLEIIRPYHSFMAIFLTLIFAGLGGWHNICNADSLWEGVGVMFACAFVVLMVAVMYAGSPHHYYAGPPQYKQPPTKYQKALAWALVSSVACVFAAVVAAMYLPGMVRSDGAPASTIAVMFIMSIVFGFIHCVEDWRDVRNLWREKDAGSR